MSDGTRFVVYLLSAWAAASLIVTVVFCLILRALG